MSPEEFSTMQQRLYEDLLAVCTGDNKCRADTHIEGCYSGGNADVSLLLAEVERLRGERDQVAAAAGTVAYERDQLQARHDKARALLPNCYSSFDDTYTIPATVLQSALKGTPDE